MAGNGPEAHYSAKFTEIHRKSAYRTKFALLLHETEGGIFALIFIRLSGAKEGGYGRDDQPL